MGYAVGIHSPERSLLSRLKTIGDFNQIAVGVTQINRANFSAGTRASYRPFNNLDAAANHP